LSKKKSLGIEDEELSEKRQQGNTEADLSLKDDRWWRAKNEY